MFGDAGYRSAFVSERKLNSRFNYIRKELLVSFLPKGAASLRLVRATLRIIFLHFCLYFFPGGHSGKHRMGKSMRKEVFWSYLSNDVYRFVPD